jgi:hypothetical protein
MQVEFQIGGVPQKLEAKTIPFSVVSENWNEYQTEDGRTVRLKLVLTRIVTPLEKVMNADGTPVALVQWQPVIVIEEKG